MRSVLSTLAPLFSLLVLGGTAVADDTKLYKPAAKMRVSPSIQAPKVQPDIGHDRMSQLYVTCRDGLFQTRNAYNAMAVKYDQCRLAEHSHADQVAAGCRANDTVVQCEYKLLQFCTKEARNNYNLTQIKMLGPCNALGSHINQEKHRFQQQN